MKCQLSCIFGMIALLAGRTVFSQEGEDYIVNSKDGNSYISMTCIDGKISFSLQWNVIVGKKGVYLRHLFLPGGLGDTHILLEVLENNESTGIINDDDQAKSLIKNILNNIETDYLIVEIFPDGRDEVTGKWERTAYDFGAFLEGAKSVATECEWNIGEQSSEDVYSVNPGARY